MKSGKLITLSKNKKNLQANQISPAKLQKLLFTWFEQHGRHNLPWQENKTPYRVWISEVMLQQTQVSTVIPYFERFMQHFPTLMVLAKAQEDEVLHLWSGLGYYSRARNLHRAAKMVQEKFAGIFPTDQQVLQSLPGVGPSTAGAIAAIAFQQNATIVDGNVKRVLTRLQGLLAPINIKSTENQLWELAKYYTPTKRVDDYTQAIMDLGATICLRRNPRCTLCPLNKHCFAYAEGMTAHLPQKKASAQLPVRAVTLLIFKKENEILLYKRPSRGIWGGLWSYPEIQGSFNKTKTQSFCQRHLKIKPHLYQELEVFQHTFTHFHLDIYPVLIPLEKITEKHPAIIFTNEQMEITQQIWYNPDQQMLIGLPKPVQSIMRIIYDQTHTLSGHR